MAAALVEQWAEVVEPNPAEALEPLREIVVDLTQAYAPAAAATAVDFYEAVRPAGSPPFTPAAAVKEIAPGTLNWSTAPLLTEEWGDALDRTFAVITKDMKQSVVETIGEATIEDPLDVRFARFPMNDDPCAYCVLRASRGAIYFTEETATHGDHLKCKCRVMPVFSDEPLPYLRAPYMAKYLDGAKAAEAEREAIRADPTLSPAERREAEFKALLAGMRRAGGLR